MRNSYVIGASAIALGVSLGTASAFAGPPPAPRTFTANIADYNAAQVATANAILTVPGGLATYSVNAGGGSLEINSRFTISLPTGFTFGSQPSLSDTGTSTFTLFGGGIGSQTATFVVGVAPLAAGQSATLNTFSVQGATALENPIPVANALPITAQSTNNAEIDNNDVVPRLAGAFASEPGATAIFVGAIQFIDLNAPTFGELFLSSPDTATIVIAATAIEAETVDAATGSVAVLTPTAALNSLSTSDTATMVMPGNFNGITAAFVSTTSDCLNPIATGTATATTLTFPGIPIGREEFFCMTASGTTLLQQNTAGFNPSLQPGTSTDFLGGAVINEFPGIITYTGGGVVSVTNFFTGDDSGYSSLLRVNNAGTEPVQLFVLLEPDTGGPELVGALGSLGPGIGTLFTEQQVSAASGVILANSGQRATVELIIGGDFINVQASSLLVNPTGVVTNVGLLPNQTPVLP
jgi:hypothetical protein